MRYAGAQSHRRGFWGAVTNFLGLGTKLLEVECQSRQLEGWVGVRLEGLWTTCCGHLALTCSHEEASKGFP